ncbi:MAG: hemerythrin domain-containing protein [Nitrospirota bacterium]|nr:hemerythrin domain-containing protein [Nitrospirota bacterium]
MDAFNLLQQDHRQASSLMIRIKAEFGKADAALLPMFQELKSALDRHAQVEELYVYPVFQQSEITRDSAAKALDDHRKMKVLLDDLAGMLRVDYRWVQKFNELYETTERHMHMEEDQLFGQSEEVLTAQEADELGTKVEVANKDISDHAPPPAGEIPRHG